jgi:hypothetical protein
MFRDQHICHKLGLSFTAPREPPPAIQASAPVTSNSFEKSHVSLVIDSDLPEDAFFAQIAALLDAFEPLSTEGVELLPSIEELVFHAQSHFSSLPPEEAKAMIDQMQRLYSQVNWPGNDYDDMCSVLALSDTASEILGLQGNGIVPPNHVAPGRLPTFPPARSFSTNQWQHTDPLWTPINQFPMQFAMLVHVWCSNLPSSTPYPRVLIVVRVARCSAPRNHPPEHRRSVASCHGVWGGQRRA